MSQHNHHSETLHLTSSRGTAVLTWNHHLQRQLKVNCMEFQQHLQKSWKISWRTVRSTQPLTELRRASIVSLLHGSLKTTSQVPRVVFHVADRYYGLKYIGTYLHRAAWYSENRIEGKPEDFYNGNCTYRYVSECQLQDSMFGWYLDDTIHDVHLCWYDC